MGWRDTVEAATVRLKNLSGDRGCGVLVEGGFVLTSAFFFEQIGSIGSTVIAVESASGRPCSFSLTPVATEPVSDIAALRAGYNDALLDPAETLADFCAAVPPVPIFRGTFLDNHPKRVHVLHYNSKHGWRWITTHATQHDGSEPCLCVQPTERGMYKNGAPGIFGDPVIDDSGELVGILANTEVACEHAVSSPWCSRPLFTLPLWIAREMLGAGFGAWAASGGVPQHGQSGHQSSLAQRGDSMSNDTFFCPMPQIWNAIHDLLIGVWKKEGAIPAEKPPVPLILAAWHETSNSMKRHRWEETLEWARRHGCLRLIPNLEDADKFRG